MSLGERFRAAREQRGLTLLDVAEQIRIRSIYLAAIEEDNWSAIGAPVYIRGFLRTYARFLALDPEEAVTAFNTASPEAPTTAAAAGSLEYRPPRSLGPFIWIASVIAVALIGFVVYLYFAPPHGPRAAAVPEPGASALAASSPEASGPAATPLLPVQPQTLAIRVTSASWLRITVDGNVRIEGTFPPGTAKSFQGKSALVRVGNAGGVEIAVDGRPVGKLGGPGDVVEKSFRL